MAVRSTLHFFFRAMRFGGGVPSLPAIAFLMRLEIILIGVIPVAAFTNDWLLQLSPTISKLFKSLLRACQELANPSKCKLGLV
jgi:hypothetical protein